MTYKSEQVKLRDVADIFSGFAFKAKDMDAVEGIPLIKIKNVNNKKVSKKCDAFLRKQAFDKKYNKYFLQLNDFLIAMTGQGSVGRIGKMRGNSGGYLVNQRVGIIRTKAEIADPEFIYQYLARDEIEQVYFNLAMGAGQPNLSPHDIGNLTVDLPPLPIQQKIARILSTYGDLIENNLKRIKLLEEMAQITFEKWFVRMKFPRHEQAVLDPETGFPEGWELVKIGDLLAKIKSTTKIKFSEYLLDGAIPIIDQGRDFIGGFTNDNESTIDSDLPLIVFGDHTRILKLINFKFARGADGTQILLSKEKRMPQHLFYYSLLAVDLSNYHYARHFKFLKDSDVLLPDIKLAEKFELFAKEKFDAIMNLRVQNSLLKEARDILLPRLMTGMIDVDTLDLPETLKDTEAA